VQAAFDTHNTTTHLKIPGAASASIVIPGTITYNLFTDDWGNCSSFNSDKKSPKTVTASGELTFGDVALISLELVVVVVCVCVCVCVIDLKTSSGYLKMG
jgi:hypothetical protein